MIFADYPTLDVVYETVATLQSRFHLFVVGAFRFGRPVGPTNTIVTRAGDDNETRISEISLTAGADKEGKIWLKNERNLCSFSS